MEIDYQTKVKKENFVYEVKGFRRDGIYKNNYLTFKITETVLECKTTNLETGKTETVEFVAKDGTQCLTKQLKKAKGKISREMLNIAYHLIVDRL